ncbi:hypothetical protein N0V82_000435 [Gnomoniopsis sp. IMI 355080]|nr:hypothetical protein N0V82_000435 [Gnomoniopsis sp. IMI 355080]
MAPSHREENTAPGSEEEQEVTVEVRRMNVLQSVWENNKGALLILISELFGSSMDAMARYLQQGTARFHTLQIIFARMAITSILSFIYMWWINVPHFPLGDPKVRGWLVLRALFGFVGLFSLYYSVHYLPLAEATVFRFLIPLVTAWSCHVFLGQVFTSTQLTAALIALVGVVIIAHPSALFGDVSDTIGTTTTTTTDDDLDAVSPAQRLFAIGMSLFGVFGAAGAYTVIRLVDRRAHALFSVNYFAFIAAAGSAVALIAIPGIGFVMPHDAKEWLLLLAMGIFGFALQFLLTTGLQLDKSPKATAMLYAQVIFALGFDFGIWGVIPGGWSLFGGAIVVASTLWSALQKSPAPRSESAKKSVVDEETALLGAQTEDEESRRGERS